MRFHGTPYTFNFFKMNLDLRSIVLFLDLQGKSKKAIEIEINNALQKKSNSLFNSNSVPKRKFFFFKQ